MKKGIQFLKPRDLEFFENFDDLYVKLKYVKRGDVFYECERGENFKLKAMSNARRINDGWYCVVENANKERKEIFVSELSNHHGPNLYWQPVNFTMENKEILYIVQ
jgi:hypothetical protein